MPYFTTKDSVQIYYKDWGNPTGQPVIFSHGWPLNSDNWESQMYFLSTKGYRCIAHDRRGHGRSSQPWNGMDMNTWSDDLAQLIDHLDLRGGFMVGHSTGAGEVIRYLSRHGTSRISKAVLVAGIPPVMVLKETNPLGLPKSIFDDFRTAMLKDRHQFFIDIPSGPFFGFNRPGATKSDGLVWSWFQQAALCSFKAVFDCVEVFSETDFTEEMKGIDIPVLILHGDDDQVVPIRASALEGVKLLKRGQLKVYPGAPHALPNIETEKVNRDLVEFFES